MLEQPSTQASVLIVDDDPVVRGVMAEYIARRGYAVSEAVDGLDAWQQLVRVRPALIISDFQMPRWDGRELCRRLKSEPSTRDIPVLIVTGDPDEARRGCPDSVAILTKPIVFKQLLAEIERALDLDHHEPAPLVIRSMHAI